MMKMKPIKDTLRKCDLFSELPEGDLDSLAEISLIKELRAGETVYNQGDPGEKLYVLHEGKVSLIRRANLGNGRTADKVVYILRELPHRRLMGGWLAIIGKKHVQMCSAKCDIPTRLIEIDSAGFRDIINKNRDAQLKILEKLIFILRERLESSYEAMETL
jgi:CRP-like cAMP-binding protein